jgi:hypothetical protein
MNVPRLLFKINIYCQSHFNKLFLKRHPWFFVIEKYKKMITKKSCKSVRVAKWGTFYSRRIVTEGGGGGGGREDICGTANWIRSKWPFRIENFDHCCVTVCVCVSVCAWERERERDWKNQPFLSEWERERESSFWYGTSLFRMNGV